MEDTTISQGIFIHKPKSRKRTYRRIEEESIKVFGEPSETAALRYETYKTHWELVQDKVQELEREWHHSLVGEINCFIETNASTMFESELVTPVGFLQTGLSTDENMKLFEAITNAVKDGVSKYVARLRSTMCPNVKTAFQNICKQLIQNDTDVSRYNETGISNLDESFGSSSDIPTSSNYRYLSIHDLQEWYETKHSKYFKNSLMKNSPSWSCSKKASYVSKQKKDLVISITKIDDVSSPATPSRSTYKSRKSLFGSYNENNADSPIPKKRSKEEEDEMEDFIEKDLGYSTPRKSGRLLRSSTSKKEKSSIIREGSPQASTPSLYPKRVSRRVFISDSPENKFPSSNDMPSPISERKAFETPKRLHLLRNSEKFLTPKRNQTPNFNGATPKRGSNLPLPIILIIDDVDYFPHNVIQQIFQLLSCSRLPVILVVGVINYYDNFSRFVPQQCSTTLMYKTFSTVRASKRLNDFFHKVMYISAFPLILSGNLIEYLSEYFLLHHFSTTRLLHAYKLCLLDYYRSPKSLLCIETKDLIDQLSDVSPADLLETMRNTEINLSQFSNAKNLRTPVKNGKILPNDNIKADICKVIEECHRSCVNWFVSLHFLYGICIQLPDSPLGNDMRELYIICFKGHLYKEDDEGVICIDKVCKLMEYLTKGELEARLNRTRKIIYDFFRDSNIKETEFAVDLIEMIEKFIDKLKNVEAEEMKLTTDTLTNEKIHVKIRKVKNTWELKQNLMEKINTKSGVSVYVNLRKTIIDYMRKFVRSNLQSFPQKAHPEIFVYDNLSYIHQTFSPLPQGKVHCALSSPFKFLKCKCCSGMSSESLDSSLPDTSIVYKLYLEKTFKIVDLNELYQGFLSIVETKATPNKRLSVNKKRSSTNNYLLRFRQAVAELQYMGFILRSKSKPDEITRQAW